MTMSNGFKRKNIRLPTSRYRGRGLYFVTLCFMDRQPFGANPRVARWIIRCLRKHSSVCEFFIHAYCVMPDHMHVLAAGATDESNLLKLVESFKQETAVLFARRTHRRLWQFKYYDHILRGEDPVDSVAQYIWFNPVRQGLCRQPAEYKFLGSCTEVGAKMLKNAVAPDWVPPWKAKAAALKAAALRLNLKAR
jgi:REP element-mobilizing transposase RayT